MEAKTNCWEFKNCGRIPGGDKVYELGVCPVYTAKELDKVNGGVNAGRSCWKVAGSFCGGKKQGTFSQKIGTCLSCNFVQLVLSEEGKGIRFF